MAARQSPLLGFRRVCFSLLHGTVKPGKVLLFDNDKQGNASRLFDAYQGETESPAAAVLKNATFKVNDDNFEINIDVEKESSILIIPADIFNDISNRNLAVKSFMLDLVSSRFSDVMWIFEQYVFTNMASRLSGVLLDQASLSGSHTLSLTHDIIARELGTAREVITRLLKQFQADGLVSISRNRIEITDINGLRKIFKEQ